MSKQSQWALARAPASVGNVAAGFDLLGHTFEGPFDEVLARRSRQPGVRITRITGCAVELPFDPARNTAGAAAMALLESEQPGFGVDLEIRKGIAFGAGLGGSAASSVAALMAVNALHPEPLSREQLYPYAVSGEAASSGARHGDNVGPMLLGGLVMATPERALPIPVPTGLFCAVVHPRCVLETRESRAVLVEPYPLHQVVRQTTYLAQLIAGSYRGDLGLLRAGLHDVLVEPRRAALVPGFARVKQSLLDAGALGGSLSGAGPSVFAWCADKPTAERVSEAMRAAFAEAGLASEGWVAPVDGPAAEVVECGT